MKQILALEHAPSSSCKFNNGKKARTVESISSKSQLVVPQELKIDYNATELMRAVTRNDPIEMTKLLNEKAVIETLFHKDRKGRTALDWARICRNYYAVTLIMKAMATAISNARVSSIVQSVDALQDFLKNANHLQGIQLREALIQRNESLVVQIMKENTLCRKEIEGLGETFFADWIGNVGYSPLILAAGMNMKSAVQELVKLKVPLDHANNFGHTALTLSASSGNAEVVHFLLFSGANIHHRTEEGRTVLHYACMYAKGKIVKIVLDFMLERFAIFRIQGHNLVDFDYTRWTTYASIFESLLNARDKDFKTCEDLLPRILDDKIRIEKRLKLSGITGLDMLNRNQAREDDRSVRTNYSYVDHNVEFYDNDRNMTSAEREHDCIPPAKNFVDQSVSFDNDGENMLMIDDQSSEMSELSIPNSQFSSQVQFSHDTDNLHVDGYLHEVDSIYTSMPIDHEISYIHSAFEKVRERISLWMSNAAKENALVQLIPCALDCGAMCKVEDMTNHVRDDCPLRTLQCASCHQIIKHKDVDCHNKKICPKRIVGCPNAFQGCREFLTADNVEHHCRLHCQLRKVYCRLFCSCQIPYQDRDNHEANHCKNRFINCDQCGTEMQAHIYPSHLQHSCPERSIKCRIGCGDSFPAKLIDDHEENICKKHCRWEGCSAKIGPPAKLSFHEKFDCPFRPEVCCFDCNVPHLTRRYKRRHETEQCVERRVLCDLGCGQKLKAKDLAFHKHSFLGSCTERLVRCPSNLVGWRVLIIASQIEGVVMKYERKYRGQSLHTKYISFSETATDRGDISEPLPLEHFTDEVYVRLTNGFAWFNIWTTEIVLLEKVDYKADKSITSDVHMDEKFSCRWLPLSELDLHLSNDCLNRKVIIVNNIDKRHHGFGQKTSIDRAVQLAEDRNKMDKFHNARNLDNDVAESCPFCGKDTIPEKMLKHVDDECMEYTLFCPLACGEKIFRKNMDHHLHNLCKKRNVMCPQCKSNELWAEELQNHITFLCTHRSIPCKFECGIRTLIACEEEVHLLEECPLRTVQCTCGLFFLFKDLAEHKLLNCTDRLVHCPQGCGVQIPYYTVSDHTELGCPNRHHIYQKMMECPNGCGLTMMKKELIEHCTYHCEKRLIECPQNCGNTVQLDLLKPHLVTCPQRVLCCEPGMKSCSRAFFHWFYKPVDQKKRDEEKNVRILENPDEVQQSSNESTLQVDSDDNSYQDGDSSAVSGSVASNQKRSNNSVLSGSDGVISIAKSKFAVSHSALSEDSSIYMDGAAMSFREQLRMNSCNYHKMSIIMATIKYDDVQLAEFVMKQVKECEDIDAENIYGDTALTLASRLGKLRFVEIIVQHGADVNKETSNGRTALIEAIKSDTENLDVIEYLIREGAIVAYKTRRHGRTSIDWAKRYGISEAAAISERNQLILKKKKEKNETLATIDLLSEEDLPEEEKIIELTEETKRLLGRPRTVRILELAAMVQKQINMLFFKIAQGNLEWVTKVIEDGDFFHPNNEKNAYRDMEIFVVQAEESDKKIVEIQNKMAGMSKKVDAALIQHKIIVDEVNTAERVLQVMYQDERELDAGINSAFSTYELLASKLLAVDIEEIIHFRTPSPLLIVSAFACGVIFETFPMEILSNVSTADSIPLGTEESIITGDGNSLQDSVGFITRANSLISAISANSFVAGKMKLNRETIINSKDQWWSAVMKQFRKSHDLVRKFQTFSRARVHIDRSSELLSKAKDLLQIMITIHQDLNAVAREKADTMTLRSERGDKEKEEVMNKSLKKNKKRKKISSRKSSVSSKTKDGEELLDGEDGNSVREEKSPSRPPSINSNGSIGNNSKSTLEDFPQEIIDPDGTVIIVEDALEKERSAPANRKGDRRKGSRSSSRAGSDDDILDEIPDAEWDSDADDAMSGEWVKGEWVPVPRKRNDWWDRTNSAVDGRHSLNSKTQRIRGESVEVTNKDWFNPNQKIVYLTNDVIQEEMMKTVKTLNIDPYIITPKDGIPVIEGEDGFVVLPAVNEENLNDSFDGNAENNSRGGSPITSARRTKAQVPRTLSPSPVRSSKHHSPSVSPSKSSGGRSASPSPSRKASKRKTGKGKRQSFAASLDSFLGSENDALVMLETNPLIRYNPDEEVGYKFMEIMLSLLKALCRFSSQYPLVLAKKQESLSSSRKLDELKTKGTRLQEIFQEQYEARSSLEKDYIKFLKKSRFLHEKVEVFKNKVRVARLMNHLSVSGHTAISWASSYGLYDMVELMLSRGGNVGYVAPIFHLVATFIQRSYRIYRTLLFARYDEVREILPGSKYSANEKAKADVLIVKYYPKKMGKADNVNLIRTLNIMKIEREKILINIKHLRSRSRFPVPEAAYTAKWEIIERIHERRLIHSYFLNTWIYPSAPPPITRQRTHAYDHSKIELDQVVAYGMNDLAAGTYLPEKGWVGANDPEDPYGETQLKVSNILTLVKEKQEKFRANRERIRILHNEALNQRFGEQDMIKAIYSRDFRNCLKLAKDRGITIDLETPDGQTALIGASEEDCDSMNHIFMKNDDGRDCLQVEFLLDRRYYRPSLNLETTKGYTALIRACMLGRADIVVALLDRGADINYQNKFKRTALHYCASLGHGKVLRILLERLADLDLKDINGNTAYDLAEKENFVVAMTLLSQFRSGNIGGLQLTRGRVNNHVLCSLGCGKKMFPHQNAIHIQEECILREVACPNSCGEETIMYRELAEHMDNYCILRKVVCQACDMKGIILKDLQDHLDEKCDMRLLPCFLGCEKIYPFKDMEKHMELRCIHRLVPCSLQCFVNSCGNDSDLFCLPVGGKKGAKKKKSKPTKGTGHVSDESMQAILAKVEGEEDVLDENAPIIRRLRYCDMKSHVTNECVNRRVVCPNRCHNVIVQHQLAAHMRDICPDRLVSCKYCHQDIKKKDHQDHEETECMKRIVPCREKCGEQIIFENMDAHIHDVCVHRTLPCIFNCHQIIQRKYYKRHIEDECRNRLVPCPYKCLADPGDIEIDESDPGEDSYQSISNRRRLRASSLSSVESSGGEELQSFVSKLDLNEYKITKQKENSTSVKTVPSYMLDQHMKYECAFRPVRCQQCNAAVTVPLCQLKHHQEEECTHRIVGCRNEGCLKHLPWNEREHHETVRCRFRMITCPQACGEMIPFLQSSVHVHRFCRLRIVDCILGCGTKVKWPDMEVHTTLECIRRHVPQVETKKKRKAGAPPPPPDGDKKKTLGELYRETQEAEKEAVMKMKNKLAQSEAVKARIATLFNKDGTSRPHSKSSTRSESRGKSREQSRSSVAAMPPISK